jgi:hypothetical protein
MERKRIIQLACEVGFCNLRNEHWDCHTEQIEAFAKLVAKHAIAQDREAVALLIEKRGAQGYGTLAIAAEVRADNACSTLCHPEETCFITEDGMCAKRGSHGQT